MKCGDRDIAIGTRTYVMGIVNVTPDSFSDGGRFASTRAALAHCEQLVVDGAGSLESALMGDLIAASAVAQGWAGVVIHGAVRDVAALRDLPLGALALGSNPRKSAKEGVGAIDVPLEIDGVAIRPGAMIWCDPDGILVER